MSAEFDALQVVCDAVAIVCQVEPDTLSASTRFADLDADSLARVSIADVVEAAILDTAHRPLHIDDASLGRIASLGELADYVTRAPLPAATGTR